MQGTYWLTVLPETSKLRPQIKKALADVDREAVIRPTIDTKGARRAGEQAGREVQAGAESAASRGSKFGSMFRLDGARDAGRKGGDELNKGLNSVDVGAGLNKKIAQQVSESNAAELGARYGRTFGESASTSAKVGLGKLTGLLATVGAGAAVVGGFKSAISAGMEFTTNLNTMGAVSNATGDQLAQVAAKARQLGADAQLPGVSAQTAAQAMTELAKGGFNVQQSMDAARGSLQLAGAAGVDATTAATIQSDTLHTFGLNADQAARVADVLAGAANGSSMEINDMALSMSAGGSVANGMKMSLEDTAATIGVFANMGIKGSDAGTSMKTALLQLTSSSKPVVGAFEELGVKAFDTQGNFIGMRGLLDQLNAASKRMTTQMYLQDAATAFGTDGVRLAMLAQQQGTKAFDDMTAAVKRNGVAAEVAAARTKGLPGAWANFKNQLDGVKLALYDKLQGPLAVTLNYASSAIEKVMPVVERGADKIGAFFTQHAPAIKAFGESIAKAFSGQGLSNGSGALAEIGRAAQGLGPAIDRAGPAMSTIGRSIASIGSGTITSVVVPAIHLLGDALSFVADHASIIGPGIAGAVVAFAGLKAATTIGGNLRVLGESMKNLFTPITLAATIAQTAAMRGHTAALTQFVATQGGATAAQNTGALATVRAKIASAGAAIAQRGQMLATKAAAATQWLFNAAMSANPIGLIVAAIAGVVAGLVLFFTKTEIGRKIWAGFTSFLGSAWEAVKTAFKIAWDFLSGVFTNIVEGVKGVWHWVEDSFNGAVGFIQGLPGKIAAAATGLWDGLKNGLKEVFNWIAKKWNAFTDALSFKIPDWVPVVGGNEWHLPKMPEFAGGSSGVSTSGVVSGPGSGTSDSILAMVSNGEGIVKERGMAAGSGAGGVLVAALNAGWVPSADFLHGMLPGFAGGRGPDISVAEQLAGTPYSQGQRFDCSGTVARVINGALGQSGGLMSTKNAREWLTARGFVDGSGGPGQIRVGWYDHGPNPNDGHMAMTLSDGRNAESGGKNGVFTIGSGAAGASDPQFDNHMYLPQMYGEGAGSASSLGSASSASGGSSRAVQSAQTAVKNAQQSVDDHTYRRDEAQKRLDAAKAKGKGVDEAQHSLDVANRELADAKDRQGVASDRLTDATNKAATETDKSMSKSGGDGGFGDLGKSLWGGLLETIGLDGSTFANPFEWPTIKSAMAGVNVLGKALMGGDAGSATSSSAGGGGDATGFIGGLADAAGLQLPNLNPAAADINAAPAGNAAPDTTAQGAGNAQGGGPAVVIENAGMAPKDVQNTLDAQWNARGRQGWGTH